MKELKTILVSNTVKINTASIPAHIGQNLAQVALKAIQRDYANPVIFADYQQWKQERAVQAARDRAAAEIQVETDVIKYEC